MSSQSTVQVTLAHLPLQSTLYRCQFHVRHPKYTKAHYQCPPSLSGPSGLGHKNQSSKSQGGHRTFAKQEAEGKEGEGYTESLNRGRTGLGEALQDLPKVEHTTHTLQLGQDWSCSGSTLFLTPTEAEAVTFFFLLWLLFPLHLCSPSTSLPALVKATTSLLWQEHFQISFPNYGNRCSPQGFIHLSPSDPGFHSFSCMLPIQFL